jgi:selenocysteine lyase/cysteine desulfurase
MERVQSGGTAFLTNTTLSGRFVLRACVLHYGSTEQDVDALLEAVQEAARQAQVV